MTPPKEVFPRQGRMLPPISPLIPADECEYVNDIKAQYTDAVDRAFPGEKIALSVVRANLQNRLLHARKNHSASHEALWTAQSPDVNRALAHFALSSPEERVSAFMGASSMPSMEAHAELLDSNHSMAEKFPEGVLAVNALAHDFDGEVINESTRSRAKVTRIVFIDGEGYAVVRTKIDGLKVSFESDEIELKMRRSGAVALSQVGDPEVRQALTMVGNLHTLSAEPGDRAFIEKKRALIEEFIDDSEAPYTGYVQSYYLTRQ